MPTCLRGAVFFETQCMYINDITQMKHANYKNQHWHSTMAAKITPNLNIQSRLKVCMHFLIIPKILITDNNNVCGNILNCVKFYQNNTVPTNFKVIKFEKCK